MTGTRGSGRVPGLDARCPSGPLQGHRLSCRCHGAALPARRAGPSVTSTGCGPSHAATAERRGTVVPERDRDGDTGILMACPLGGVAAGRDAGPRGGQVCPGAPTAGGTTGGHPQEVQQLGAHRARYPPPGVPNSLSTHQEGARGPTPQHRGHPQPLPTSPRRRSAAPRSPPENPPSLGPAKLISGWETSAGQERSAKCDYCAGLAPPGLIAAPFIAEAASREGGAQSVLISGLDRPAPALIYGLLAGTPSPDVPTAIKGTLKRRRGAG